MEKIKIEGRTEVEQVPLETVKGRKGKNTIFFCKDENGRPIIPNERVSNYNRKRDSYPSSYSGNLVDVEV